MLVFVLFQFSFLNKKRKLPQAKISIQFVTNTTKKTPQKSNRNQSLAKINFKRIRDENMSSKNMHARK